MKEFIINSVQILLFAFAAHLYPSLIINSIKGLDLRGDKADAKLLVKSYFITATKYNNSKKTLTIYFPGKLAENMHNKIIDAIGYKVNISIL